jgi:8-oxo-dGTP pyrophosphatase MutT (NUDIX family)
MDQIPRKHKLTPAAFLALIVNKKILLLHRQNTGYEDGKYSLIAGHVEKGESFTKCVIREAKEEAGITIQPQDLKVVHVMQRWSSKYKYDRNRIDVFFTTKKWIGEITNTETEKCKDLTWFDLDKLPENIIPCIKEVIENIQQNIFYSEYGLE